MRNVSLKFGFGALLLLTSGRLQAEHTLFFTNANSLTTGTVSNALIDSSSVTKRGNTFNVANSLLLLDSNGKIPDSLALIASTNTVAYGLVISTVSSGNSIITASASFINVMGCETVDFTSSAVLTRNGPGGLDVGVVASSQSYALLAIANSACTQFGVMFTSQPFHRPIMPSGFTKWRPLANIYNNSGGTPVTQIKRGRKVTRFTHQVLADVANLGTAESLLDLTQWVSSNAVSINLHYRITGSGSAGTASFVLKSKGQIGAGGGGADESISYVIPDSVNGTLLAGDVALPVLDKPIISFYELSNVVGFTLFLTGYEEEF